MKKYQPFRLILLPTAVEYELPFLYFLLFFVYLRGRYFPFHDFIIHFLSLKCSVDYCSH